MPNLHKNNYKLFSNAKQDSIHVWQFNSIFLTQITITKNNKIIESNLRESWFSLEK